MYEYLFSYGTLQQEQVQVSLFGRTLQGDADTLKGYKTSTIEITDALFLSKGENTYQQTAVPSGDKSDFIHGTILAVTLEELLVADDYEPEGYKRIKVELQSGKQCWIYVANAMGR